MVIYIQIADVSNAVVARQLGEIIDSYAREPGGQNAPLSSGALERMGSGLIANSSYTVFLAYAGTQAIGAAVCFIGFSTFAGKPFLNVHDLAVLPEHRGKGVGQQLLTAVEGHARACGCGKITLEVHDSNEGAKRLYRSAGFGPWDSPTLSLTKPL